jgi:CRISPR-associated exonuclease Cas4
MDDVSITGTIIWYYYICKREVWLISHGIEADQENDNIVIGKTIHENAYKRSAKEIEIINSRIDMITHEDDNLVIVEIKKSSKTMEAAKMQLLFYIYQLSDPGIKIKGELRFPKEKRIVKVELTDKNKNELENAIAEIETLIKSDIPPLVKNTHCRNCAYSEFCWS